MSTIPAASRETTSISGTTNPPSVQSAASSPIFWIAAIVIGCASGAVLGTVAATSELWLDEVWTIQFVQQEVHSPTDVIFQLKHDNNHFLNSLVVYLVGPEGSSWDYRWPAVVAGVVTVLLSGWVQRRRNTATAITAMLLTACSYLLVQYSHEARGYSYLLCFTMLAYASLCEAETRPRVVWEILFCLSSLLGFLSHSLFVSFFLAAQVWTWLLWHPRTLRWIAIRLVFRTLLPGLFFAWLYWINLRHMDVGGGMHWEHLAVVVQTLSLTVGGPFAAPLSYVVASITILVSLIALWHAFRESPRRAIFYLSAIVIFPALIVVVTQRADIYERYFLGSVLFLLLMWSDWLGMLWGRSAAGRVAVIVLMLAYMAANGQHIARLLRWGHNHYQELIEYLDQHTAGPQILVNVDHPFRQGKMFQYYFARTKGAKNMTLGSNEPPQWCLAHSTEPDFVPPATLDTKWGTYRLAKHYPFAGMSGWHLVLYEKAP